MSGALDHDRNTKPNGPKIRYPSQHPPSPTNHATTIRGQETMGYKARAAGQGALSPTRRQQRGRNNFFITTDRQPQYMHLPHPPATLPCGPSSRSPPPPPPPISVHPGHQSAEKKKIPTSQNAEGLVFFLHRLGWELRQ